VPLTHTTIKVQTEVRITYDTPEAYLRAVEMAKAVHLDSVSVGVHGVAEVRSIRTVLVE
jgi:hypothetical protein